MIQYFRKELLEKFENGELREITTKTETSVSGNSHQH